MKKKMYVGTTKEGNDTYISWELKKGKFSASGEVWDKLGYDTISGGQNLDEIVSLFPGNEQAKRIHAVWNKWHLNDMKPGSPKQTELVENVIRGQYLQEVDLIEKHTQAHHKAKRNVYDILRKKLPPAFESRIDRVFDLAMISFNTLRKTTKPPMFTQFIVSVKNGVINVSRKKGLWNGEVMFGLRYQDLQILNTKPQERPEWYTYVCDKLDKLGRLRDPDFIVDGEAYKYGSRWLTNELPDDVREEILSWEEVEKTTETPIEILCREFNGEIKYIRFKDERHTYKLTIGGKEFDYFTGSGIPVEKTTPAAALGAVLSDGEYGKDGYVNAEDYMTDLGYTELSDIRKFAKGVVESYEKLHESGVWDRYQQLIGE